VNTAMDDTEWINGGTLRVFKTHGHDLPEPIYPTNTTWSCGKCGATWIIRYGSKWHLIWGQE
jgi:hypothetical protein